MKVLGFLLIISTALIGQENDSLLQRILLLQSDTEKVNQLYKRGFNLRTVNASSSFQYAKLCEKTALTCGSEKHLAKSYNLLGILHYRKGNYTTALNYHTKALDLRHQCHDELGIAYSQTNLGNIYVDLNLFHKAERCYLMALEAYRKLNNKTMEANTLVNLGVLNQSNKHSNTALEYYKLAHEIGADLNDYDIKSLCLNNMAGVYFEEGNYEKSIAYNQDALKLRDLIDNTVYIGDSYLNLANNYIELKQCTVAKPFLDRAYQIGITNEYFELNREVSKSYATLYSEMGEYKDAFSWLTTYLELKEKLTQQEDSVRRLQFFDEQEPVYKTQHTSHPNTWLLIMLALLILFIPFFIIRFKR